MTGAGQAVEYVECPFCDFKAPTEERVKEHAIGWCKGAEDGLTLDEINKRLARVEQNSENGGPDRHPDGEAAVDELELGQDLALEDGTDRHDDEPETKECPWCERTFDPPNAGNALGGHKSHCPEKPDDDVDEDLEDDEQLEDAADQEDDPAVDEDLEDDVQVRPLDLDQLVDHDVDVRRTDRDELLEHDVDEDLDRAHGSGVVFFDRKERDALEQLLRDRLEKKRDKKRAQVAWLWTRVRQLNGGEIPP